MLGALSWVTVLVMWIALPNSTSDYTDDLKQLLAATSKSHVLGVVFFVSSFYSNVKNVLDGLESL